MEECELIGFRDACKAKAKEEILGKFQFSNQPYFFLQHLFYSADHIFFGKIDDATLFSPGGCRLIIWQVKMACVVAIIIEKCTC